MTPAIKNDVYLNEREIVELYDKVDLVLDWSREEVFRRCPREAYFSYKLRLKPEKDSDALVFGSLISKMMETCDVKVFDGYKDEGLHGRDFRTRSKALELFKLYQDKFGVYDQEHYTLVGNEFAFGKVLDIDGRKVLVKGRLDQVLCDKNGMYWAKDYKHTATWTTEDYYAPFYLGAQSGYYLWALAEIYGPESVGGFIVDLFKVTARRTDDASLERKIIDAVDVEWEGFRDVARGWLHREDANLWPRVPSHCRRYNKLCPFYLPCYRGEDKRNIMKAGLIKKGVGEWHL